MAAAVNYYSRQMLLLEKVGVRDEPILITLSSLTTTGTLSLCFMIVVNKILITLSSLTTTGRPPQQAAATRERRERKILIIPCCY